MGRKDGRSVDVNQFHGFVTRVVDAYSQRVGNGELEALPALVDLRKRVDAAIDTAVGTLRHEPHSKPLSEIAAVLGVTRQAAGQRWGHLGSDRKARKES